MSEYGSLRCTTPTSGGRVKSAGSAACSASPSFASSVSWNLPESSRIFGVSPSSRSPGAMEGSRLVKSTFPPLEAYSEIFCSVASGIRSTLATIRILCVTPNARIAPQGEAREGVVRRQIDRDIDGRRSLAQQPTDALQVRGDVRHHDPPRV